MQLEIRKIRKIIRLSSVGSALILASLSGFVNAQLLAGSGKSDINIPKDYFPNYEGFTSIHDTLQTRSLVFQDKGEVAAIVVVELTSIHVPTVKKMKDMIYHETGIKPENVFLTTSHTFSAPHIQTADQPISSEQESKNRMLEKAVINSIIISLKEAINKKQPATVAYGIGSSNVNINRDTKTVEGWWFAGDSQAPSDKDLGIVALKDTSGKPFAFLMNYAVQSSIMDHSIMKDGGRTVTSDLGGAAVDRLEALYDNKVVALFGIGAAGDQQPIFKALTYRLNNKGQSRSVDFSESALPLIEQLGFRLGDDAYKVTTSLDSQGQVADLKIMNDTVTVTGQVRPQNYEKLHQLAGTTYTGIHPVKKFNYQASKPVDIPISIIKIGDVVIVGIQPEITTQLGMDLKKHSPFKKTILLTMVNGAAKYMADEKSYDRITYEAMNSFFYRGSAEIVENKILTMLNEMAKSNL